jgi:hypothetical protein
MNKPYQQSPRFNATSVATGSILALIVAMAISVVFDIQPVDAKSSPHLALTSVTARA